MRYLLILISLIVLNGCSKVVTNQDIEIATKYCSDKGGVYSIQLRGDILNQIVNCKNGKSASGNRLN